MHSPGESLPRSPRLVQICRQFRQQWVAGRWPRIEAILEAEADTEAELDRDSLLRELLAIELQARQSRGDAPTIADYTGRFPNQLPILEEVFAAHAGTPQVAATVDFSFQPDDTRAPAADVETGAASAATQHGPTPHARQFGDYEILEEIARGGMGVVYRARQMRLNRMVALKMIKSGDLADTHEVQRFFAEAEAAARLEHPHIVPIYEIGEHQGQHFFSMKLVEGASLKARLAEGPMPAREAAELLKPLAAAVQFAHERGIVHRDLKPANVLLDRHGWPRVTDFGLAKQFGGDSELTKSGQVMGTPSYMPPEQAAGEIGQIGPHSDVYSLGAILYCALTGRPPFQAASVMETLQQVQNREPVAPRQLNPTVDRDLETICLKCLEKSPARRFPSAQALSEELDRFLQDLPIVSRRATPAERAVKWARRRPALAALAIVSGVAALAVTALGVGFYFHGQLRAEKLASDQQRDLAQAAKQEADQQRNAAQAARDGLAKEKVEVERQQAQVELQRDRVRRVLYCADINLADQAWQEAEVGRMMRILNRQVPTNNEPDLRGFEWYYLNRLSYTQQLTVYRHRWATGDQWLSRGTGLVAVGNKPVRVWEVGTGQILNVFDAPNEQAWAQCVALSEDGKTLALGRWDGTLEVWDRLEMKRRFSVPAAFGTELRQQTVVGCVAMNPDATRIATGEFGNDMRLWDSQGELVQVLQGHTGSAGDLKFSPDGSQLATASSDRSVRLWNGTTGEFMGAFGPLPSNPLSIAWSKDGQQLAIAGYDGEIELRNLKDASVARTFRGHRGSANEVDWHPDGGLLASCGHDGTVRIWNVADGRQTHLIRGHTDYVSNVAWLADGERVVSTANDGTSRVWNVHNRPERFEWTGHNHNVSSVSFRPDGDQFATAGRDGALILWETASGRIVKQLGCAARGLCGVAWTPDGKGISAGGDDGNVYVWDQESGQPRVFAGHTAGIQSLRFTPDGGLLVSASNDQTARIWDVASGAAVRVLEGHTNKIFDMALSPSGLQNATGGHDGKLKLWDTMTGQPQAELSIFNFPRLCYSPDGSQLLTPGMGFDVSVIKIADNSMTSSFANGHDQGVSTIAYSPDGQRIATGSYDKSVRIWDVETGQQCLVLPATGPVYCLAFSPNGRWLVAGCDNSTLIWDSGHVSAGSHLAGKQPAGD
ncbi:MAG: protein kinase [Pirellulales bacterium]